ncbi:MAG: type III-B CRISPR module RAMP protein Cmr6, partial [Acidobacteria bacterium]|nr:type III-B CRISPR module RAMP protein Cmr6 [Acidobacteriota bacterium]MCI0721016.1 type III-B CRISPR module RAMP protein Cmr6 [Acidobacteriota bacterium]
MSLVLPESTVALINGMPPSERHPGLQLDKYSIPGDQTKQKATLADVCGIPENTTFLKQITERRRSAGASLPGAISLSCTTLGPLTLHLARAAVLENAGICLHPIYGFAYLPGSGLKGMARAYAETVWLPSQPDDRQGQAWRQIVDVFGWTPGSDKEKDWKPKGIPERVKSDDAHAGNIVFHDAWPETWPKLVVDIVNNHHKNYYAPPDEESPYPPGDWEDPRPVYFLALKSGTTFTFPLSKRRQDVADVLLVQAKEWLSGALCHLGTGAKTGAGYGAFKPTSDAKPLLPPQSRATFETMLELVTPAFLAGASQRAEDCDLRPATLRGLLRWWWRTMHAGFVDVKTLRGLEAAIWGDTRGGGTVRIVIERVGTAATPLRYQKRQKANFSEQQKRSELGIPNSDARKTTQGLWYASYGMDEGQGNNQRQRHYLEPGALWRLCLAAQSAVYFDNRKELADPKQRRRGKTIAAAEVLQEAKTALWLLCHYGAVGSKARKGFGSFVTRDLQDYSPASCLQIAKELREQLGLSNEFKQDHAHLPSLQQTLPPVEVSFSWPNLWNVLDQVGFAYQAFAKKYKHRREKMALGLPRRIGPPIQGTFNPTTPVMPTSRHSSPVHIHVGRNDGGWTVRVIAFPAAYLPDFNTSRKFLVEFLKEFGDDLRRRSALSLPHTAQAQPVALPKNKARQTASVPVT